MTVATKKIADQVLALPKSEIAELLILLHNLLPASPEDPSQKEWDEAWKSELNQRIAEMESGEDPGVSLDVIWEDLEKIRSKR